MRKVIVYMLLSLDGVAEQPDAFFTEFDDAMEQNLASVIASQDAVLLGRRTYDEWARFWPGSDIEPFASFINGVQKFVVTSTAVDHPWQNSTVVDGPLAEFVTELKQQLGGDIGVHGSIVLAQGLLEANLVDELRLVVAPAVQIDGLRLFERGARRRLALRSSATSPAGYLLLDYEVLR